MVTEKLDGENTTLYADGLHARSLDSAHHPSRAWVKALHGRIGDADPGGWRVCGENMYARHSIAYDELDSWFYGFSVWDGDALPGLGRHRALPAAARRAGAAGAVARRVRRARAARAARWDTTRQEGYVVRTVDGFDAGGVRASGSPSGCGPGTCRPTRTGCTPPSCRTGSARAAALWAVRSGAGCERGRAARGAGRRTARTPGRRGGARAEAAAPARTWRTRRGRADATPGWRACWPRLLHARAAGRAWHRGSPRRSACRWPGGSPTWWGCTPRCTGRTRTRTARAGLVRHVARPTWACCTRSRGP